MNATFIQTFRNKTEYLYHEYNSSKNMTASFLGFKIYMNLHKDRFISFN